jgi:hypothetical protein
LGAFRSSSERIFAFEVLLVRLPLPVVHDVVDHAVDVLVLHRRQVDLADVAVHADHRWQACGQVQIRRLVLDDEGEQLGNVHGYNPLTGGCMPHP